MARVGEILVACLHAVASAARRKHEHYADVTYSGVAKLVVLRCEVHGRWGVEAVALIRELAQTKALEAPSNLRAVAKVAWASRWWGIVSVGVQKGDRGGIVGRRGGGADLLPPSAVEAPSVVDVVSDHA